MISLLRLIILGEHVDNYEDGKLKDHAGAWIAGIDSAKPGIWMKANPQVDDSYRQECYKGEAEDMAEVLATNETVTVPYGTFKNCVKTLEWTPLEPELKAHKYYCPEVGGTVLEVELVGGERKIEERVELVDVKMGVNNAMLSEIVQTTLWELRSVLIKLFKSLTDQLIVPKKRGNACGGKGLAGEPLRQGHIFSTQRQVMDGNETGLITYPENDKELLSFYKIPLEDLKRHAVRTYSPITEYGGWGIKGGSGGKAYNVSGNRGVQLEFTDGKRLLIGSQKPEQFDSAIEQYLKNHDKNELNIKERRETI